MVWTYALDEYATVVIFDDEKSRSFFWQLVVSTDRGVEYSEEKKAKTVQEAIEKAKEVYYEWKN